MCHNKLECHCSVIVNGRRSFVFVFRTMRQVRGARLAWRSSLFARSPPASSILLKRMNRHRFRGLTLAPAIATRILATCFAIARNLSSNFQNALSFPTLNTHWHSRASWLLSASICPHLDSQFTSLWTWTFLFILSSLLLFTFLSTVLIFHKFFFTISKIPAHFSLTFSVFVVELKCCENFSFNEN